MIREFEIKDIDAIMNIWKKENIRAHSFIPKEYWESNYDFVKEILPNAEVYVEFVKDKVVGFIGIIDNHIEGIFVDHHHQGNGVGTALLHEAKTSKYHLILHVYKQNANAIRFYQKNDFVITEEHNDENTGEIECTMNWHQ